MNNTGNASSTYKVEDQQENLNSIVLNLRNQYLDITHEITQLKKKTNKIQKLVAENPNSGLDMSNECCEQGRVLHDALRNVHQQIHEENEKVEA